MIGNFRKKHQGFEAQRTQSSEKELNQVDNSKRPFSDSSGDILCNRIATLPQDRVSELVALPGFRGNLSLDARTENKTISATTADEFYKVADVCSTGAIKILATNEGLVQARQVSLDMGKCILCGRCQDVSPNLLQISSEPARPVKKRSEFITEIPLLSSKTLKTENSYEAVGNELKNKIKQIFGRSVAIREVDAGSCNGCEVEITALNNPIYDIERFGIHFVASPRHADVLLVTGPASRNMEIALRRTYEATPDPKLVIAVGACACSGGIFGDSYATTGGIDKVVPVDVYIPGCPPRPEALLYGLLLALDRV